MRIDSDLSCNYRFLQTLPKWFVDDNKDRLYKPVVLLTNKAWSLRLAVVHWQRATPDVVFCGGWKAFAISSNLSEGDQLVFKLSGMSQFDAYIFNPDGTPKTMVPPPEAPTKWSGVSELPKVKKLKSSKCSSDRPATNEKKASANGLCGLLAKEETGESPNEQENDVVEYDISPSEDQEFYPSFFKRLTETNFRSSNGAASLVGFLQKIISIISLVELEILKAFVSVGIENNV